MSEDLPVYVEDFDTMISDILFEHQDASVDTKIRWVYDKFQSFLPIQDVNDSRDYQKKDEAIMAIYEAAEEYIARFASRYDRRCEIRKALSICRSFRVEKIEE